MYLPCQKDINADELAESFYARFVATFAVPANLISYRGSLEAYSPVISGQHYNDIRNYIYRPLWIIS